jgi:hypothetical protein
MLPSKKRSPFKPDADGNFISDPSAAGKFVNALESFLEEEQFQMLEKAAAEHVKKFGIGPPSPSLAEQYARSESDTDVSADGGCECYPPPEKKVKKEDIPGKKLEIERSSGDKALDMACKAAAEECLVTDVGVAGKPKLYQGGPPGPQYRSEFSTLCLYCMRDPCAMNENETYDILAQKSQTLSALSYTPKEIRYHLYREITAHMWGPLGKGNRKVIPHCVITEIHDLAPDPCLEYTGFKEA